MNALSNPPMVTRPGFLILVHLLAALALLRAAGWAPALVLVLLGALSLLVVRAHARRLESLALTLDQNEDYVEGVARLSTEIQLLMEEDRILYLSDAMEGSLGHAREDFRAGGLEHLLALVHPEDQSSLRTRLRSRKPEPEELAFRMRDNHGTWRWLAARSRVLREGAEGGAPVFLTLLRELSAERSLEAAQARVQKLETAAALMRGTIHDMNNALMGIQGYAEIPGDGELRAKLLALLERVRDLCGRMSAQVGAGRVRIGRVSLDVLIRSTLPQLEAIVPDTVSFETELQEDLPAIHGDEVQIRHALLLMLTHSVETLGGRVGGITLRTLCGHRGWVCVCLEDRGPGLLKAELDRVFDPPQAEAGVGSGLGAVRSIAQLHGGEFRIQSDPGEGSRYMLCLPTAPGKPGFRDEEAGMPPEDRPTVLVMDDDPDVRYVLRHGLEGEGFRVLEGGDGVEGFDLFLRHRQHLSLVLLDLTMPRMGGQEVLEGIRSLSPETPVVLMSGYSREEATAAFEGQGLAGFLPKPCKLRDALGVVRDVLGRGKGSMA